MNEYIANKKAEELFGKQIDKWTIGKCLGSGKTAFVCEAFESDSKYAIKVFMNDLLNESEIEELKVRLNRQMDLVDKYHPNLVKVYGAGYCERNNCFYLVMEYIQAPSLNNVIKILPRDRIKPLISQIASAAKYLEELNLVHRDIKPENIVVLPDFSKAVLLDFGVIRRFDENGLTDSTNTSRFIGTLRYSSPEFLLRKEEHDLNGWRALTFYQIGAVLHDMIMQYPIFEGSTEPFAKLVHAIDKETPVIFKEDVDSDLIDLAKRCLLKSPDLRLKCVAWEKFEFNSSKANLLSVCDRIKERTEVYKINSGNYIEEIDEQRVIEQRLFDLCDSIDKIIRTVCIGKDHFPRIQISSKNNTKNELISIISFPVSQSHGLFKPLYILIVSRFLDYKTKFIQLECIGYISDNLVEYEEKSSSLLYEGFCYEKDIQTSINDMIHFMFEQAQLRSNGLKNKSYDVIKYSI